MTVNHISDLLPAAFQTHVKSLKMKADKAADYLHGFGRID